MEAAIKKATWELPRGHKSVAAFAAKDEASARARELVEECEGRHAFYLTDLRGSWEVIRYL